MSCVCENISGGISLTCSNNIGGIKEIYVTEKCNISSITLGSPDDSISAITMVGVTKFYKFEFTKNSSSYTEVTNSDSTNGTELTTQTVILKLNRREKTKRDALELLGKFKNLAIIVKDNNDLIMLFGENNGMNRTTQEGGSGVTKTDANGYTITFVGEEPDEANFMSAAVLATVIA